ncbi:MAG TPA: HAD family hydrolase [Candidatus Limnocylindrales bacterium]|nr:HAD family hydrolase [Candidatus Limnocylindrales bacterium]
MPGVDLARFDALTFDCYGTLIDWERGILDALHAALGSAGLAGDDAGLAGSESVPASEPIPGGGSIPGDEALLEAFARHEAAIEAGPYVRYREVLRRTVRAIGDELGHAPGEAAVEAFGGSVAEWPAFPDSPLALADLTARFRLGVITNCDDDLFAASERRLGVRFDEVVTAQQARRYKPNPRGFELMFERLGLPTSRILHVAQSLYHDHVPAKRLGLATAWVNRRAGRAGAGATPPATATPDLVVPDLRALADLAIVALPG